MDGLQGGGGRGWDTIEMRTDRLPLTYAECRARFHRSATLAGLTPTTHPIEARGPDGAALSIDVVTIGAERPRRALAVLSGVHGVEGFIASALQCDLLGRLTVDSGSANRDSFGGAELEALVIPEDMAVVMVHAVNPWGMAWWRRQNEHNVDLNRNWARSDGDPVHNDAYDEVHALACPDSDTMPSIDDLLGDALALVEQRGLDWVKAAITKGQYRHPDGLHFGGDRTEESNRILEQVTAEQIRGVEDLLVIDLHTGHGPSGEVTHLAKVAPGSEGEAFLKRTFGAESIEATSGNPETATPEKSGSIAQGLAGASHANRAHATTIEFGTAADEEQLAATYAEQWVYRCGDRTTPEGAAAAWTYRCCFTPDDHQWEQRCLAQGREHLHRGVRAVANWPAHG